MRLLFLAPRPPQPPTRGDQRRVTGLLEGFAGRGEVTLVTFGEGEPVALPHVRTVAVSPAPSGRLGANLRRPAPRLPAQVRLYLDGGYAAAVERELASGPDVVHVTLARLAPYLPAAGPWHRHLDLVDSLAINMRTRADASRGPMRGLLRAEAAAMARYEAAAVRRADSASLVSAADRAAPGLEDVPVVPNGVDLEGLRDPAPGERPPVLVYFGNLGYFHALEPARFVAEDVLPLVRRAIPGATLRLVGARPPAAVRRLGEAEGVEVVGPVPAMAPELHRAAVAVLPAFTGSGMKNKVLEAMAAGAAVVANPGAMEGIEGARPGDDHLLAEGAEATARACVDLLADGAARRRLAGAARALVEDRYSWGSQAEKLMALYARAT